MGWPTNVFKWLGFGRYNTSPPTLANGDVGELQLDSAGNLKISGSVTPATPDELASYTSGLANGGVIHNAPAKLYEIDGFNTSAATRYLVLVSSTSIPADTTSTSGYVVIQVPASGSFSFAPTRYISFSPGLVWVCSTTAATITKSADFYISAALYDI